MGFRSRLRGKQKRETQAVRWAAVGAIAAVISIPVSIAIAALADDGGGGSAGSDERGELTAPADSDRGCIKRASSGSFIDQTIEVWYCETRFANFWRHGKPTMFTQNKPVLKRYFPFLDPRRQDRHVLGFTENTLSDTAGLAQGGKLSRIFHDFPAYQSRFAFVGGQVRDVRKLVAAEHWTDWVVQLGTRREGGVLVYARFSKPPGWKPRPQSKCTVGFVEGLPIARGYTDEQGGDAASFDVIYEMATDFGCLGRKEVLRRGEVLLKDPALAPYVKRGMNPDAW